MAKRKSSAGKPKIFSYTKTMDAGIKKLSLAATYAEDGAQMDAIRCAAEAIGHLIVAKSQRDAYMAFKDQEEANG